VKRDKPDALAAANAKRDKPDARAAAKAKRNKLRFASATA